MVQAPSRETSSGEEPDRYKHTFKHTTVYLGCSSVALCLCDGIIKCVLEVKRYVRKGVPNEHRAKIWMAASGAQEQLESNPGHYQSLLAAEHDPKLKETIQTGETKLLLQPYLPKTLLNT